MMLKLAALTLGLLACAGARAAAADDVTVQDAYVRQAPPGAQATAAFMVLKNGGEKTAKVVKAENPASRTTEMHNHINDKGVMMMRPVKAIEIKARGETTLQPGGLHLMLIDPKPMQDGDVVAITLGFDDGSSKKVEARVMKPSAMPMPEHGHQHRH